MKIFSIFTIIASIAVTICLSAHQPNWLGNNSFLQDFISHELISLLGVVLAITFASVENINLYLSKIEREIEKPSAFTLVRKEVNRNIYGLVICLLISIGLLIFKGYQGEEDFTALSFVHGFNLVIVLVYIFSLVDIFGLMSDMSVKLSSKKKSNDTP